MKRSSIFLIVLLTILVIMPIVYIGLVARDVVKFKDWVVEEFNDISIDSQFSYKMRVTSLDSTTVPDCYINVTTYEGIVTDTLQAVNFVVPADGVTAVLRNDSIIVVLDNVKDTVFDGLCLTVEIPENSQLEITNSVPTVDIHMHDANVSTLRLHSMSDFDVKDSNIGTLVGSEKSTEKTLRIADANIGAFSFNGDNASLTIDDSNVGALSVSGTCRAIKLSDSKIGCCSWNDACNNMAVIEDCVITTQVQEGELDINTDASSTHNTIQIEEDGSQVNISPIGVKVNSEDANVDISPNGVHVDSDEATVHITPTGLVVKEGGEEVVRIGLGGVKVNNQ